MIGWGAGRPERCAKNLEEIRQKHLKSSVQRTYVRYTGGVNLLDPTLSVVETAETMSLGELRSQLIDAAASISSAQARLAQAMAVFRARHGEQHEAGFDTFGQWASVDLGFSSRSASALADAGDRLGDAPTVREAWQSGALSTAKATAVLRVATPKSESSWCTLAKEASATQLNRIAGAYRRCERSDIERKREAINANAQESSCGVWWRARDDGLAEMLAILKPDDAAVVRAAIETEIEVQWRDATTDAGSNHSHALEGANGDGQPSAPRPTSLRRADALVAVGASRLASGTVPIVRGERTEVVLHVDERFLTGAHEVGRCSLTNGESVDLADARRLACDARIRALVHGADGTVVDLGRAQRLVSDRQRRLLTARDHGCRFPGCSNNRYVDAHHVIEWNDGGPTDMNNLILLCNRHHRLVHHESFRVEADGFGDFTFFNRFNQPIRPPTPRSLQQCRAAIDKPRARSGGDPRYSVDLAVAAMSGAAGRAT